MVVSAAIFSSVFGIDASPVVGRAASPNRSSRRPPPTSSYASTGSFRLADTRLADLRLHDARRHDDAGRRRRTVRHRRRHHRRGRHGDGDEHHRRLVPDRVPRRSSGSEHVDRQPAAQPRRRQHGDRPGRRRRRDRHPQHDRHRPAIDVVVDVTGFFVPAGSATQGRFVPAPPERILDTRRPGSPTGRLAPGGSVVVPRPAGVAADSIGLVLNVTSVEATEAGFLNISPTNGPATATSFMNPDGSGDPLAAFVIAPLTRRRSDDPRHHRRSRHRRPDRVVHRSVGRVELRWPVRADLAHPPPRHPRRSAERRPGRGDRGRRRRAWCRPAPPPSRPT